MIVARAIVRDAYPPENSARVIARASTWIALAPIIGPILGSYLQVTFGWRAAFVALGLFSSMVFAASVMHLPETNQHKNPRAIELSGMLATYRPLRESEQRLAKALNIEVVAGRDLNRLGERLKQWVKPKA